MPEHSMAAAISLRDLTWDPGDGTELWEMLQGVWDMLEWVWDMLRDMMQ